MGTIAPAISSLTQTPAPKKLGAGCRLTIREDIVTCYGAIIFKKGQQVKVSEVVKTEGRWARFGGYWIPEKIDGVRIAGHIGLWYLSCFEETCA